MTISSALTRFVLCPLLVAISDYLFQGIDYALVSHWVITGAMLAIAGILMDSTLLDRLGHVGAFITDVAIATLIVWVSQLMLPGALVSWPGAFGAGLLVGLSEVLMHLWIQQSRRLGVRRQQ